MSSYAELRLDGELTIYRAQELKRALTDALEPAPALRVDLAAVSEIDSAGVQLLLAAKKTADAGGKALALVNPSASVASCLALYDLSDHFACAVQTTARAR